MRGPALGLYAGFAGNLQEKVPLLMAFTALSAFIILPVHAFFWYGQESVQPFDKALNTVGARTYSPPRHRHAC